MEYIYAWKGIKEYVIWHVLEFNICQRVKHEITHLVGLLQPLPIPFKKWYVVFMDFIVGLPKIGGKSCIFVILDRLTQILYISFPFLLSSRHCR